MSADDHDDLEAFGLAGDKRATVLAGDERSVDAVGDVVERYLDSWPEARSYMRHVSNANHTFQSSASEHAKFAWPDTINFNSFIETASEAHMRQMLGRVIRNPRGLKDTATQIESLRSTYKDLYKEIRPLDLSSLIDTEDDEG